MVKHRNVAVLGAAVLTAIALSSCSSTGEGPSSTPGGGTNPANNVDPSSCSSTIYNPNAEIVTLWSWSSDDYVDAFNKDNSDVQVCLVNAGAAQDEYSKFSTVLAAGTGGPDLIQIEYPYMTSFIAQGALADLTTLGVDASFFDQFEPAAVADVSSGDSYYGVPFDGGPFVFFYRSDLFAQAGIDTAPTTWAEYATDAQKLHDALPGTYIGAFETNEPSWHQALFAQAGGTPYVFDASNPTEISIGLNDAASTKVLTFWDDLIDRGLVTVEDLYSTDYNTKLADGTIAGFVMPAWGHFVLQGAVGDADGDWAVAPMPQWDAANPIQVNNGGSAFAVTTASSHQAAAAKVATELYTSEATQQTLLSLDDFPVLTNLLASSDFLDATDAFLGGAKANVIYAQAYEGYSGFTYGPTQSYAFSELGQELAAIVNDGKSVDAALADLQSSVVQQAKSVGLNVTEK